jgi:hypothetical protein
MRRLLIATAVFAGLAGVAAADEVWLKDGRSITTKKPLVTKGSNALLTTADGVLVSIPLAEIDLAKTAEARRLAASPTPVPTPNLMKPMTPAEAARQKSSRKAVVVLTDDAVAHGFGEDTGERRPSDGEGRVEVANTSATRGKDGYTFTGTVINAGNGPVSGVSVTIEAVASDGKTFSSAFAQVAKDSLQPGEKSTFTASAPLEGEAATFRYMPRWQVPIPPKEPKEGSAKAAGGSGAPAPGEAAAEGEPTPAATPPPAPTLVPVRRPDVAPPAANAPSGNPASGAFIPQGEPAQPSARPPST